MLFQQRKLRGKLLGMESDDELLVEDGRNRLAVVVGAGRNEEQVAFFQDEFVRANPVDALAVTNEYERMRLVRVGAFRMSGALG